MVTSNYAALGDGDGTVVRHHGATGAVQPAASPCVLQAAAAAVPGQQRWQLCSELCSLSAGAPAVLLQRDQDCCAAARDAARLLFANPTSDSSMSRSAKALSQAEKCPTPRGP